MIGFIALLGACHSVGDMPGAGDTDAIIAPDSEVSGDSGDTDASDLDDPFADAVVSFTAGEGAGFGQEGLPDVVLGPPEAPGNGGGATDVVSLGQEGEIVLEMDDIGIVDGEGPDLLVFENPFTGWYETGVVAVSYDGESWYEWPCAADDSEGGYPGCAGVAIVYSNSENGIDPTDPETAGGDAFDLDDLGVSAARYVRIRDSGANAYDGTSGGFDLDAVAVVNGASL